jgi:hypothetical protein
VDGGNEPGSLAEWVPRTAESAPERQALRELVALRAALDRIEALLVAHARADHVSWTEIGRELGITKQSAHRRHAASTRAARR